MDQALTAIVCLVLPIAGAFALGFLIGRKGGLPRVRLEFKDQAKEEE